MASNQSWDDERTPSCTRKVHQLEGVDMLTVKIDLLMKKLENPVLGHSNNGFCSNQGFKSGWNKPSFPFDNHQQGGNGQSFNRNEPQLWDIIRD
jgi:hypothetical protein